MRRGHLGARTDLSTPQQGIADSDSTASSSPPLNMSSGGQDDDENNIQGLHVDCLSYVSMTVPERISNTVYVFIRCL